mmetsp:Transcript_18782/g.61945  ORF Transcript_18782/g.61945 Transcript_18782/m.61945 type:complete len:283 (-) Transcript_18782:46-894(-)
MQASRDEPEQRHRLMLRLHNDPDLVGRQAVVDELVPQQVPRLRSGRAQMVLEDARIRGDLRDHELLQLRVAHEGQGLASEVAGRIDDAAPDLTRLPPPVVRVVCPEDQQQEEGGRREGEREEGEVEERQPAEKGGHDGQRRRGLGSQHGHADVVQVNSGGSGDDEEGLPPHGLTDPGSENRRYCARDMARLAMPSPVVVAVDVLPEFAPCLLELGRGGEDGGKARTEHSFSGREPGVLRHRQRRPGRRKRAGWRPAVHERKRCGRSEGEHRSGRSVEAGVRS